MTFKQFAFNNVKRNTRQYLSYFLSCMFSVTVFFMFAVLIFHPDISHHHFRESIKTGIISAETIIFAFSFLFVLYSTGSFIKSRKKEYGLLTTLGISKGQLNRMLIIENTIIGLGSIIAGILLGSLLSKMFIMLFSEMINLKDPLRFYISPKAIGLTALAYFIVFELNSIVVVWTIRTNSVMELFRGDKAPKKAPKFSWILSILSIISIGYGYYLAYSSTLLSITSRMLPILIFIVPGTYFLFTQASIASVTILKSKKKIYFRKTNLLLFSDIVYKLKDNARLLFLVTILSSVAFTSSGVLFGIFNSVKAEAEKYVPQDVTIATQGKAQHQELLAAIKSVETTFKKKKVPFQPDQFLTYAGTLTHVEGEPKSYFDQSKVQILSWSEYQQMVKIQGRTLSNSNLQSNEVLIESPMTLGKNPLPKNLTLNINQFKQKVHIEIIKSPNINGNYFSTNRVIVPDHLFHNFAAHALPSEYLYFYTMRLPQWSKHVDTTLAVLKSITTTHVKPDSRADFYTMLRETFGYSLFFGIFISVLFFLAAGSILYFRLYQDINKDLEHYQALYRLGLTTDEMRNIVNKELAFLFFIPFIIAVIHSGFAFKALQNIVSSSVLVPSIMIIGGFLVIHAAYFIFIKTLYTRKLDKVM